MPWIISAAADRVELDAARQASITFTVTNNGPVDDRAVLDVEPGPNSDRSWFAVGERQRFIPRGASLPFLVKLTVPPEAAAGASWVQGRVYSADTAPEESSVLSDRVAFEIKAGEAKAAPNIRTWLIPVVVLVVVTLGVLIGWAIVDRDTGPAQTTSTTETTPPTTTTTTPAGPDVTNVQRIHVRSAVVAPGQNADATATCPAGTVIIGGGYWLRSTVGMVIDASRPAPSGQGWHVHGFNPNAGSFDFDVEAVCATVRDHEPVFDSVVVQPGQQADATVSCPAGKASTGGGGSAPGLVINVSRPSGQGWQVRAVNTTGIAQAVTAYAMCATAPAVEVVTTSTTVLPGTRWEDGVACPAGKVGTGAGFSFDPVNDLRLYISTPEEAAADVRADNRGGSARDVTAFAVCATKG